MPNHPAGRWKSAVAGALLAAGAGVLLLPAPFGGGLARLGFDLLFLARPDSRVEEVVIVYLDEPSAKILDQPWTGSAWNREVHARLIRRLVGSGARAIVFDVLFDRTNAQDTVFLGEVKTARQSGVPVVVGIGLDFEERAEKKYVVNVTSTVEPFAELKAVTDWGLAERPDDQSDQPRRHYAGREDLPSLAMRTAELIQPGSTANLPQDRWINFYGPAETLPHRSYAAALDRSQVPDAFFSNKVCFVGALAHTPFPGGKTTDEWHTPYTRWGHGKAPGVEITATVFLNLVRHESLTRLSASAELLLVLAFGVVLSLGLTRCRPTVAALLGVGAFAGVAVVAGWLAWQRQVWFSWLILGGVQMPLALVQSFLTQTRRLASENSALQKELERLTEAAPARVPANQFSTTIAATGGTRVAATVPAPPPGATLAPSTPIPDHALLRCIGKGGYGEVWLARNVVGTCHAVKIVRRHDFEDAGPFEREFHGIQKVMPISRQHPGLVQILHAGRNDAAGFFYYVMEPADDEATGAEIVPAAYVPKSLASELKRHTRLPVAECLRLGLRLTEALEFLHAQGLIHRDIKPPNIIFVRGEPKLADIGLVTEISTPAVEASYVGTRGYIPPEGPGQPAADVFSLGRVLYEACMGLSRDRFPELPETILNRPGHELLLQLNQIIMRACDDDLTRRYASAAQMHADLQALEDRTGEDA